MGISTFFESYLQKQSLFRNKEALLNSYVPETILYREEQIQEAANILAPVLRLEKPSNLFIYGKTGTGKTISVKHIIKEMQAITTKNMIPLKAIYVNCKLKKVADTEYRLIAQLVREFGMEVPSTGLPTDEVYNMFYQVIDRQEQSIILILDEIDHLTKKIGDDILYNLTRVNVELNYSKICLVGISNNLVFAENLDPRVKSSLSEEEIIFPPYNAIQIQDILRKRAAIAFHDGTIETGVIEKCSAYAAREHGDARRAIDLFRVAGEIAERSGSTKLQIFHLDEAERKVESDKIVQVAVGQPKQFQTVLYSILAITPQRKNFFTGEIYEIYSSICKKQRFNILTQRRVSDILAELDMFGNINAKIISKGRYGRTREISIPLEENLIIKLREVLEKSLQLN